jgi:hypothetical protein
MQFLLQMQLLLQLLLLAAAFQEHPRFFHFLQLQKECSLLSESKFPPLPFFD